MNKGRRKRPDNKKTINKTNLKNPLEFIDGAFTTVKNKKFK